MHGILTSTGYLFIWALLYKLNRLDWLINAFPPYYNIWIYNNQILILCLIVAMSIINIPIFSPFQYVKIRLNIVGCILPLFLSSVLYWYCPPLRHLLPLPILAATLIAFLCAKLTDKGVLVYGGPIVIIALLTSLIVIVQVGCGEDIFRAPQVAFIAASISSLLGGDIIRIPLAWLRKDENTIITINVGGGGAADAILVTGLIAGTLTDSGLILLTAFAGNFPSIYNLFRWG